MSRRTKFTKERTEIILGLIREGYSVADACKSIGIGRPSENYQSPNNLPFTMPNVYSGKSVDEIYEEWWRTESVRNAY